MLENTRYSTNDWNHGSDTYINAHIHNKLVLNFGTNQKLMTVGF